MIDISIFIPSRKRPALLRKCIDSFFLKAQDASSIEMIILMDFDDPSFDETLTYVRNRGFNITIAAKNRSQYLIRDYQNVLARACTGHYCWGVNDECEVQQEKWDTIFKSNIPGFQDDKVRYVQMDDDANNEFCSFPAVSRETIKAIDGYMPKEKLNWGADVLLYQIFKRLSRTKSLDYEPIVDMRHLLKVTHFSPHTKKTERDEVYRDIDNYNKNHVQEYTDEELTVRYTDMLIAHQNKEEKHIHTHHHYHVQDSIVRFKK